jgi:hypothetical protein
MATTVAITLPAITVTAETGFTVTRLREFVTSGLSDAVLQTYLDAAMDAIDDALGPLTCKERLHASRGDMLMLGREAESITSVVEDARNTALTLAADDYELSDSGQLLYRLRTGTNPRWGWHGRVDVTYVRSDDMAERIRVAVALVQLDLGHAPGLASQTIGTWSETYRNDQDYAVQRDALLASLTPGIGMA